MDPPNWSLRPGVFFQTKSLGLKIRKVDFSRSVTTISTNSDLRHCKVELILCCKVSIKSEILIGDELCQIQKDFNVEIILGVVVP